MIISSAKDFRTVVTNSRTGESILELPASKAYTKISWSTPLKGKACGMDNEGNTSILSFLPEGL
jgi:hypothetical protein